MALASVLVPVYHVEEYLSECLDSILEQTLSDIEIICVNDGSTREDAEILQRYAAKDKRIKIINKPNGGLPSARNAGIKAATGEYLAFVDADDRIKPNMLEKLYKAAKRDNSEIVICGAEIFPTEPKPEGWLYAALSPQDGYYEKADEWLLFNNPSVRPFIWRTFVKRELLIRNGFLLNESIHVGEDNAFQLRIYPKAKGITVIADKLYEYRWFRENSLMNTLVYNDAGKKCLAHIKMVCHVADEWIKSGEMERFAKGFLNWCAEFLYDDFIKLPLNDRIDGGRVLSEIFARCGYERLKYNFLPYIREMLEYFFAAAKESPRECTVSAAICASRDNSTPERIESAINNCLKQSLENLELIIVNNSVSSECYAVIHKYLHADKRVRVYNAENKHYTDGCNIAAKAARGRYLLYLFPFGHLADEDALSRWVRCAEEQSAELVLCGGSEDNAGCALYRTEFIAKSKLSFKDYSIMSGSVFIAAARLLSKKKSAVDGVYRCEQPPARRLNSEDCALMLRSVADRLTLAEECGSAALYGRAFDILDSGYFDKLVTECLDRVYVEEYGCADTESPVGIAAELMRILSLLEPEMLSGRKLPRVFSEFADGRHKYIAGLSDEYVRN